MYVSVKVHTAAKREAVKKIASARFEVSVRQKAERNMANDRVVAIMAALFKVPIKNIRIVKGQRHASKLFEIDVQRN